MLLVEPHEFVKLPPLLGPGDAGRSIQVEDRRAVGSQQRALIGGWQIPVCPHRGPVDRRAAWILNHDVPRHVLVRAAQPVIDPRTDRGAAGELAAGGHMQGCRPVILVVCLDAVNEGQIVNVPRKIGKQFRQVATRLTVTAKVEFTTDARMGKAQPSLQLTGDVRYAGERLAVQCVQQGLVFERIHLAHAALHEQEDAVPGLPPEMRLENRQRIAATAIGASLFGKQPTQGQTTQAIERPAEEFAT